MHFLGPYTFYFCQILFNKIFKFCFQLKHLLIKTYYLVFQQNSV